MDRKEVNRLAKQMEKNLKKPIKKGNWGEIDKLTQLPEGILNVQAARIYNIARNDILDNKKADEVAQLPELIRELFEKQS